MPRASKLKTFSRGGHAPPPPPPPRWLRATPTPTFSHHTSASYKLNSWPRHCRQVGLVKLCFKFCLLFYSFIPKLFTYYSFDMYLLFSIMLVKRPTIHPSHVQKKCYLYCSITESLPKQAFVARRHLLARRKHVCKLLMMAELEQSV